MLLGSLRNGLRLGLRQDLKRSSWMLPAVQQRCLVCTTCLAIANQVKARRDYKKQQLLLQDKSFRTQTRNLKLYQPSQQCVFPEYDLEVNEYMRRKRFEFDIREHWSYRGAHGMEHWASYFPSCQGKFQSPINLNSFHIHRDAKLNRFMLKNFNTTKGVSWLLENNGKTVMATLESGDLTMRGGGLYDEYGVWQFHFHWGSSNEWGSEHTVDGKRFPLEMHLVTYNLDYGTVRDAIDHSDGLAVLGTFFEVSQEDNSSYDPLIQSLRHIRGPGNSHNLKPMPLRSLLPPDIDRYYRYHGSLTTPPCSEVVIWTLFGQPVPISTRQLDKFRELSCLEEDSEGGLLPMVDNFREIQPLSSRKVTNNF